MKGICGQLLDIDLTTGKTKVIHISDDLAKKYIGGRGLGARLLFDLLPPKTDPLSPENLLIFLTGPLTGSMVCGSSKFVVVTKSPLTGGWCDSYSSGRTSLELKKAGYDGLVIRGKAAAPCYLKIGDGGAEILSAEGIWGRESFEAERLLKDKEGKGVVVTSIGPAGENLCLYACINSDHYRQAARAGVGAVMGSKNLKALVVKGSGGAEFHDRKQVVELNRKNYELAKNSQLFQARSKYGTSLTLNVTNTGGILPTQNFQYGSWDKALGKLDSVGVYKSVKAHRSCQSCFVHCSLMTEVTEGPNKGELFEGPEYETLGMFGSNLLIESLQTVIQANLRCDTLGLDTISMGNVIGFVMECFEKGLLTTAQTEGFELRFGDDAAVLEAIELTARRQGFGEIMSRGVRAVAAYVGQGSERFAMHVKGLEFPAYDPRGAFGAGLSYAVSPRGACHRRAWPPAKEILGGYPPFTAEGKGKMVRDLYAENCVFHSLLVCDMPAKFIPVPLSSYSIDYYRAVTGVELTAEDFDTAAGRVETLIRMFNNREGFSRSDDWLPYRTLHEPMLNGPAAGQCIGDDKLNRMLDDFYAVQGWDKQGVPTAETLRKYGLAGPEIIA
jgi:aldehyde:ferredoxin oxidoreductase